MLSIAGGVAARVGRLPVSELCLVLPPPATVGCLCWRGQPVMDDRLAFPMNNAVTIDLPTLRNWLREQAVTAPLRGPLLEPFRRRTLDLAAALGTQLHTMEEAVCHLDAMAHEMPAGDDVEGQAVGILIARVRQYLCRAGMSGLPRLR